MIRAMIASGIVPSAIAGRIRCRNASAHAPHWPVISALKVSQRHFDLHYT